MNIIEIFTMVYSSICFSFTNKVKVLTTDVNPNTNTQYNKPHSISWESLEFREYYVCLRMHITTTTDDIGARSHLPELYQGTFNSLCSLMRETWLRVFFGKNSIVGTHNIRYAFTKQQKFKICSTSLLKILK